MFEFLFEILAEFLLQFIGQALLEIGLHSLAEPFRAQPNPWLAALGCLLIGSALGGVSLLVAPGHFTAPGWPRTLSLVCTPLAAGAGMAAIGAWRQRRGQALFRIDKFAFGYLFALAFAVVRFKFAA